MSWQHLSISVISQLYAPNFLGALIFGKVKAKSRQGQGKVKVRSRQHKHNLNHNYNLMGFDIIELTLTSSSVKWLVGGALFWSKNLDLR